MTEVLFWSGWVGGIGIGVYALVQFFVTGKRLGVSTGFMDVCASFSKLSYFKNFRETEAGSWRIWFIIGIPLGGLVAALTSPGELVASFSLGKLYDSVFPTAIALKGLILLFGGVLIGYGSRMAGGCTSGHSIAGIGLLNWPSLVASAGFFIGGIVIVNILFRVINPGAF